MVCKLCALPTKRLLFIRHATANQKGEFIAWIRGGVETLAISFYMQDFIV